MWRILPGSSRAAPCDNTEAEALFALDVCDLQCFGDTLKVDLLDVQGGEIK